MAIKVLINELGQHLVADVKQVTDTETKQLIAYWVKQPLMISYTRTEGEQDGGLTVTFVQPVPISADTEYAISAQHIVSILDVKPEVREGYLEHVTPLPPQEGEVVTNENEDVVIESSVPGLLPKPERPVAITPEVV